jgi:plastocyanin
LPAVRPVPAVLAALLVASLVLGLTACSGTLRSGSHHDAMHGGRDARNDALVVGSGSVEVLIRANSFQPGNLQLAAGSSVIFTNLDRIAHTATARDGSWDTGLLGQGDSWEVVFSEPGVYEYYCIPHPSMRARIEVAR